MSERNYYAHLTDDENIHNCFTAYVIAALRNQRTKHVIKNIRHQEKTRSLDELLERSDADPALVVAYEDMELLFSSDNTLENIICNDMLLIGILKLNERERRILNLRIVYKMRHAEIADLLGLKSKTVEKAYERLMGKLRSHMRGCSNEEF